MYVSAKMFNVLKLYYMMSYSPMAYTGGGGNRLVSPYGLPLKISYSTSGTKLCFHHGVNKSPPFRLNPVYGLVYLCKKTLFKKNRP